MKVLRIIFSKWSVSALLFLAQVAAVVIFIALLNQYYALFQILSSIIGVVVFLYIINRKENSDYKIAWLFLVLFLPLFGVIFYLLFSQNRIRKKDSNAYIATVEDLTHHIESIEHNEEVYEAMGDYQGVARYLKQESGLGGQMQNDIKYYPVGEEMWKDMLEELAKAKKFILMEYFIIDPGKMWESIHEILVRKAKEGVKVHLVYDDVGTVTMLHSDYYKKLRKEGIDAHKFNPFVPIVSGVYNNRDHRKIMVIDGKVAFTGGVNLGDEYINENHRLGHWKDTGLRIKGSAVNSLSALFFTNYVIASRKKPNYDEYFEPKPEKFDKKGIIIPFGDGPRPIFDEQVGEANFMNILDRATKYFYITTPYLIIDYQLTTALRNAALRGVDVRIITPHIPDKKAVFAMTRSSYAYLQEAGVKIYEYTPGFVHAKQLISDDVIGFVGTINLDYRSLTHHFECGAVIYEHECLKDLKADFESTFGKSQLITKENFKLSFGAKAINALLATFRVLF